MLGQTLSHYHITEQIGAGGMGVVYLARDQRLERDVALKVLPSGTLSDEVARKRFRREALTLSRLNHPNVATIFDFDSDRGTDFLVTEYISGVTLDTKLAGGALPPKEVVGLGIQLAEGLAAAHAQGIVHRDLKPANLRLTNDGRLKILDFGLAQLVQPENDLARTMSLTSSQQVTGTLPYMAPEQLRGEPVDARSDVWAAAAVLYEMATGQRPFPESNGPLLIDSILNRTPEPPSRVNHGVSPGLENVILKGLEKDPARRYQSSRELGGDLERLTAGVSPLVASQPRLGPLIAGAVVLLLLLAVGAYRVMQRKPPATPASVNVRRSVAVLGFKNLSGRPDTAWLSTALSEMLTTELAAGEKLLTISGENVARVKTDLSVPETDTLAPDTLARVRQNLGSDFVVLGSYLDLGSQTDDQIRLDLRLQDAAAGQTIAVVSEKGTLTQLDDLVTRAGAQLRERLDAGEIPAEEQTALRAARPANLEASRLYAEGLAKLRNYDALGARAVLLKAVAADPKYAPSLIALSAAWSALGYDGKSEEAAKRAYDVSASLPRDERLQVEGQYYEESSQWDKAIASYSRLFDAEPDNLDYGLKLANAEVSSGKINEALATVARLRALPSPQRDDLRIDLAESRAAHLVSDFRREMTLAAGMVDKGQKAGARLLVARARLAQCTALRQLGDPKSAIADCQEARRISGDAGDRFGFAMALNNTANALYDQGDLAGARNLYEEAVRAYREIGNQQGLAGALDNIASLLGDQGDHAGARKLSEQALTIYRDTGYKTGMAETLNNIGADLVARGELANAQKSFQEALDIWRQMGNSGGIATSLTNIGDLRFNLGDLAGAQAAYQEASATFEKGGEKGKSAYPQAGLGDVLAASGDLASAKTNYEEALAKTKASGEKHQSAFALTGIGQVLLQQADLAGARRNFEEALAVRTELGEKEAVSDSLLDLARISMEEGRAAEAEVSLRQTVDEIHAQKAPDREASARALLALALVMQDRSKEARAQIAQARALCARSQHRAIRWQVQIAAGRVEGRQKIGTAAMELESAMQDAGRLRFVGYQFEARLVRGEIAVQTGKAGARADLEALEKDARARGFGLVAEKAAKAGR